VSESNGQTARPPAGHRDYPVSGRVYFRRLTLGDVLRAEAVQADKARPAVARLADVVGMLVCREDGSALPAGEHLGYDSGECGKIVEDGFALNARTEGAVAAEKKGSPPTASGDSSTGSA
jgi:hypothetical protein